MSSIKQAMSALLKDGLICSKAHSDVTPGQVAFKDRIKPRSPHRREVETFMAERKQVRKPIVVYSGGRTYVYAARDVGQAMVSVIIRRIGERRRHADIPAYKLVPM